MHTLLALALSGVVIQGALCADSHTDRQSRPIPLGVSGGSTVDLANGYCCSGTLGSLVKDSAGTLYILSNTHVLAGDSSSGGNGRVSAKGDPINQPGYIDVNCEKIQDDYVATLEKWVKISPNGVTAVDAAIAKIHDGKVDPQGVILGIGPISSTPKAASIGQKVKKSGRTSGLTNGEVAILNATITVQYTKECAGKPYRSKYKNQIIVKPGSFLQAGDSGSLLVEDVSTNPRPIGLLFAGSSSVAIANPIQDVLNALQVTMVGVVTPTARPTSAEVAMIKAISNISQVQEKHSDALLQLDGVVGHGVAMSQKEYLKPVLAVLVTKATKSILKNVPKQLDGVDVETIEVGQITAY